MTEKFLWLAALIIVAYVPLRALLRRGLSAWEERVTQDANTRLQLRVPEFARLERGDIVDRVIDDPGVEAQVRLKAKGREESEPRLFDIARAYAEDIVPRFKAVFYFRIGYRLARGLLLLHYRVRSGRVDAARLNAIDEHATVILVMNHLSTIDVLLVNYLASRHSTVSHFAGEWSTVTPLYQLQKLAGNCIVQRETHNPLYRAVLKSYVQLAVANGMHLGIFPEGELSRSGRMEPAKLGLLNYASTALVPDEHHDVVFIPVGLSYEQVLEDSRLVYDPPRRFRERGKLFVVVSVFGFVFWVLKLALTPRSRRCGIAAASFGTPISLAAWRRAHAIEIVGTPESRPSWLEPLWRDIAAEIRRNVPVLPAHLLAAEFLNAGPRSLTRRIAIDGAVALANEMRGQRNAVIVTVETLEKGLQEAFSMLERRGLIQRTDEAGYRINGARQRLLQYYVATIEHLLPIDYSGPAGAMCETSEPTHAELP